MINNITVCVYGYKSKEIINVVDALIQNKSNENNIFVCVIDQHQFDRKNKFNNVFKYNHVFWDNIDNPNNYKNKILYKSFSEYFLQIGDGIYLNKNWDKDLINMYNSINGSIISGNNTVNLFVDKYKIKNIKIPSNDIIETGYIDRNFVFSKTNILKQIGFPKIMKYNGDSEEFSCNVFNNNIKIYCLANNFYIDKTYDLNNHPYVPFSLDHGYGKMKNILLNSDNFLKFHNINISDLKDFPFFSDDVYYDLNKSIYNLVGGEKFYTSVKEIG